MEAKQASARDLLNDAARVRDLEKAVSLEMLQKDRERGKLDARTTDEQLQKRALNAGWHAQAQHIIQRGVSISQYNEFDSAINAVQHPNGAGWTEKYGNLRTGGADQRRRNTKMGSVPESAIKLEDSSDSDWLVFYVYIHFDYTILTLLP